MHGIKRRFAGALMALPVIAGSLVIGGTPAQAIVGGKAVATYSYPYLAKIEMKPAWYVTDTCDGTLISPDWVLTADHCVVDGRTKILGLTLDANGNPTAATPNPKLGEALSPAAFKVTVGTEQQVGVSKVVRYPKFQALRTPVLDPGHPFPADFALLKLKKASSVTPLALAASEPPAYHNVIVAGWGCTAVDPDPTKCSQSTTLNEATVSVFPDSSCGLMSSTVPNSVWRLSDFCTKRDTTPRGGNQVPLVQMSSTIRPGDSGGPVIERTLAGNRLVGVISGLVADGNGLGYDLNGSIAYAAPWIKQVTGISAPAMAPIAGDLNGDGSVNCADVSAMQNAMAAKPPQPPLADLNHDGKVDVFDLSILLAHWDPSLPPGC